MIGGPEVLSAGPTGVCASKVVCAVLSPSSLRHELFVCDTPPVVMPSDKSMACLARTAMLVRCVWYASHGGCASSLVSLLPEL